MFADLEDTKYQHTEYRISIYGRKSVEWDILAAWVCNNRLYSDKNVWLIQVPRLYQVYKAQGLIENFERMLENLFLPLFEVTADPDSHPQLHIFLQQARRPPAVAQRQHRQASRLWPNVCSLGRDTKLATFGTARHVRLRPIIGASPLSRHAGRWIRLRRRRVQAGAAADQKHAEASRVGQQAQPGVFVLHLLPLRQPVRRKKSLRAKQP